jgi:cytoskeleton protein RodZ
VSAVDDNADKAASRPLGQTLAAARERQGLSRSDAAQRLHMSAWQIEALETGDYGRLPKGTFLRGFVRNYAKVLNLSAEPILGLLPEEAPRDKKPGIVVPTQNIRFDPIGDRLQNPYVKASAFAFVALALGFAAMYWVFYIRPHQGGAVARKSVETPRSSPSLTPQQQPDVVAQAPVVSEPVRVEPPKAAPPKATPPKIEPPRAEPPKAEPPKAEATTAETIRVGTDGKVLKFRFKGSSWVEIRDKKGKVLLSRLNPAGSEAEVAGQPPFNVIVGNAPEVQLFYDDHEFNLEPHTKVAVARFTVE